MQCGVSLRHIPGYPSANIPTRTHIAFWFVVSNHKLTPTTRYQRIMLVRVDEYCVSGVFLDKVRKRENV